MRTPFLLSTAVVLALACGPVLAADSAPAPAAGVCPACDDGDPCTVDSCTDLTQTCHHEHVSCDDGNPCTVDSCLAAAGGGYACRNDQAVNDTPCDDGESCTTGDACRAGVCVGEAVTAGACDDGNPCTDEDVCAAGVCKGMAVTAGTPCDDHNTCTADDACTAEAVCAGRALHAGEACDDGNPCTGNDRCADSPGGIVCAGASFCDDGDVCTEDRCDAATGICSHPPVSCDDRNSCTADSCDSAAGRCQHTFLTSACDDGLFCTVNDTCQNGTCVGQPITGGACSDGSRCTVGNTCLNGVCQGGTPVVCRSGCMDGFCDPDDGHCVLFPNPSLCGPPGQCSAWSCQGGGCQQVSTGPGFCTPSGTPRDCGVYQCLKGFCDGPYAIRQACDDHNPCTLDSCPNNQSCTHVPLADGGSCRTSACSAVAGICVAGQCTGEGQVDCDDHNPCTVDTCGTNGCEHTSRTCDDDNDCTIDTCAPADGSCVHAPVPDGRLCSDGNGCTGNDRCMKGICRGGASTCNDDDNCTIDTCLPNGACDYQPIDCRGTNPCSLGFCTGGDPPCIQLPRTGLSCDDPAHCVVGGMCDLDANQNPYCRATQPDNCEDGDPCTAGVLQPPDCACVQTPTPLPKTCGLGACRRSVDACDGGVFHDCVPGTPEMERACNGVDDDCDGAVDENDLVALCNVRPRILRDGGLMHGFTVMCRLRDRCQSLALLSPLEAAIDPAYVSAADLAGDASDNVEFPDPSTLACAQPDAAAERGLAEDVAMRQVDSDSVTFAFDRPSDGVCSTLDGGRRDLVTRLADLPDGSLARVCVASRFDGRPFEGCGSVRVRH